MCGHQEDAILQNDLPDVVDLEGISVSDPGAPDDPRTNLPTSQRICHTCESPEKCGTQSGTEENKTSVP